MRAGPWKVEVGLEEGPRQCISTLAALKSTGEHLDLWMPGLHPPEIPVNSVSGGAPAISIFKSSLYALAGIEIPGTDKRNCSEIAQTAFRTKWIWVMKEKEELNMTYFQSEKLGGHLLKCIISIYGTSKQGTSLRLLAGMYMKNFFSHKGTFLL